jgi:SAM-dependent methyltransferase
MLERLYREIANSYDMRFSSPAHQQEDNMLFAMLHPFTHGAVLDIGCGTGLLLENISIPASDYLGLDPSSHMLDICRKKFPAYQTVCQCFEDFNSSTKWDTIFSLYGSASYIKPDTYKDIPALLAEQGSYFLMVYRPDYYPHYYSKAHQQAVGLNINYKKLARLPQAQLYQFSNYIVITNRRLDLPTAQSLLR